MKKKLLLFALSTVLSVSILAGCSSKAPEQKTTANANTKNDTVASASQAPDEATFEKKISKDGNYIIITNKDLTFTKDLTVDGRFTKKDKDGKEVATRSLAFASETADGKVKKRFTVTVPRIVINSENTLLEIGKIKGDVYVQAPGFKTKDATIDGNLYFATQELMDAFKKDDLTKITGTVEVCQYTK
jgi:outer membrane murein-binding lipoprotein Lpp